MKPLLRFVPPVIIFVLDHISKQAVLENISEGQVVAVAPFFNLVLAYNRGISFSMLNSGTEFTVMAVTVFTSLITLGLMVWLFRAKEKLNIVALGLVIGGALGNIYDRLTLGAVVDFLDFHAFGWHYPAFNVADSAVVCGAGLLLLQSLVFDKENRQP